jgi:hypothetical protein
MNDAGELFDELEELEAWRRLYQAALLELDMDRLFQRIADAEKAIDERTAELLRSNGSGAAENENLASAQMVLNDLKRIYKAKERAA